MYYAITVRLKLFAIEKFRKKKNPTENGEETKKNTVKNQTKSPIKKILLLKYMWLGFFPVKYIWNDAKKMIRQKKMANQLCNSSTFAMNL